MQYDEFVGQVQHRARLPSTDDAVRAIRSTLETLGQRLQGGEARHLAAQLPDEIARFIRDEGEGESFSMKEFLDRVARSEGVEISESVHHTRAVLSVLQDAISPGEMRHVRGQLPEEWQAIFDAGSEGKMEGPS